MMPPGLPSDRTIVIVDISWWLNQALNIGGLESILSTTIGKLVNLLRGDVPSFLAVAADSVGPTWRHEMTDNLRPEWRYKGNREPRPAEYHAVCNQVFDVIRMHRIPILYAEGYEADDVMGAAAVRARADGLYCVLLTLDKDMGQMVDSSTFLWDGKGALVGAREVEAHPKHPVEPRLIPDLLAIASDRGDNIPGVDDIGPAKASALLRHYGGLPQLLAAETPTFDESTLKQAERDYARAKRGTGDVIETRARLVALREARDIAKWTAQVHALREAAALSYRLTRLDLDCPIQWDLNELAIGGYDARSIRETYRRLGFTMLAQEVSTFPKVLPDWMIDRTIRDHRQNVTSASPECAPF